MKKLERLDNGLFNDLASNTIPHLNTILGGDKMATCNGDTKCQDIADKTKTWLTDPKGVRTLIVEPDNIVDTDKDCNPLPNLPFPGLDNGAILDQSYSEVII